MSSDKASLILIFFVLFLGAAPRVAPTAKSPATAPAKPVARVPAIARVPQVARVPPIQSAPQKDPKKTQQQEPEDRKPVIIKQEYVYTFLLFVYFVCFFILISVVLKYNVLKPV